MNATATATITYKSTTSAVVEVDGGDVFSIGVVEVRPATISNHVRMAALTDACERSAHHRASLLGATIVEWVIEGVA